MSGLVTILSAISGILLGGYTAFRVHKMNGRSEEYDQQISDKLQTTLGLLKRLEENDDRVEVILVRSRNRTSTGLDTKCTDVLPGSDYLGTPESVTH